MGATTRNIGWAGLAIAWCALVGLAMREVYAYATTSGAQGQSSVRWPAGSTIPRAVDGLTIAMFIHPDCPCSRASVAELREIMETRHAAIAIVFTGATSSSALWEAAGAIPGAHQIHDPLGVEARRFGAMTSGHVVIFDAAGIRKFTGGITGSRGHVGDNIGRRQVEAILDGRSSTAAHHAVFGCSLDGTS